MNNQEALNREQQLRRHGRFSKDEEIMLLSLYAVYGPRFDDIAEIMDRTKKEVKDRFRFLEMEAQEAIGTFRSVAVVIDFGKKEGSPGLPTVKLLNNKSERNTVANKRNDNK